MRRLLLVVLLVVPLACAKSEPHASGPAKLIPPASITTDSALGAAKAWIAALAHGPDEQSWSLVDPGSQTAVGGGNGYANASARWTAWSRSAGATYTVVPVSGVELGVSVVLLRGTVDRGTPGADAAALVVRGQKVDPFRNFGTITFTPGSHSVLTAPTVTVEVPAATTPYVSVDAAEAVPVPTLPVAPDRVSTVVAVPQVPGTHTVTMILRDAAGAVAATAALYTTG